MPNKWTVSGKDEQPFILLRANKVTIEAATRLVHRRAPVGVGSLHNRADRPSTGSRAPVAQSLNLLISPSISEARIMNFYPTGNFRPLAAPEQRLISE